MKVEVRATGLKALR